MAETQTHAIKLAVLQRTWHLSSRGAACRARQQLQERAARLAATPHNQAEAIASLVDKAEPVLRAHGIQGLRELLREA
ncbi:MAG TPA: hypothetical protein VMW52_03250 [Phycisphaerae bacterium]|nr:hypothetical protein [Phycisphaerae bacterium]